MYRKKILAKESFGMPRLAAALSITNTMNPHLFFFLHPYRSCSPATFSSTFSTCGRSGCNRTSRRSGKAGWRGRRRRTGGRPWGRGGPRRKRQGPSAQHAKLPRSGEWSSSADFFSSWMPQPWDGTRLNCKRGEPHFSLCPCLHSAVTSVHRNF